MTKKVLICEFHDSEGNQVKQLSRCPASPDMVVAAMQFLDSDCDIVVSVQDLDVDEKGKIINNPLTD